MSRKGSSMVEFALVAPVLLLLLAGVLNFGVALRTAIAVSQAARAGAQYAASSVANSSDVSGIAAATRNAAPAVSGIEAATTRYCKCASGSAVACTAACSSGPVEMYVTVNASATAPVWFRYAGLGYTGAVAGGTTMRVR